MYKSDKDITKEFDNFRIVSIEVRASGQSGYIELEFPEAEDSVGGGTNYVVDQWIQYDSKKIAFDNWYPDKVYFALVNAIKNRINE